MSKPAGSRPWRIATKPPQGGIVSCPNGDGPFRTRPTLPVVASGVSQCELQHLLPASRRGTVRFTVYADHRGALAEGQPVVGIAAPSLRRSGLTSQLALASADTPAWMSLVVITGRDLGGVHRLLGTGIRDVFSLPGDFPRLRELLDQVTSAFEGAVAGVLRRSDMHFLVRAAVARLRAGVDLSQDPPADSLAELARSVGCSASHLRMVARDAGIDLGRLRKLAVLERAHRRKLAKGESWERTALALGYSSVAGLANLAQRNLQCGLSVGETVWRTAMRAGVLSASHARRSCEASANADVRTAVQGA